MLLAEANQWPADLRPYFGNGDEFHMAFHFPLMPRMFMGLRLEDRKPITEIMQQTPEIPASCQWCLFLRNHDELTLEMVTDIERDYMYDIYARDKTMRLNLGIRRRLAPLLDNDRRRIELMNGMLMSLPGTPIIYYGDEIGMGDNIYLRDRNGVRTPMQWSSDRNAGFSRADPARLFAPPIMEPVYGYQPITGGAQARYPFSLPHRLKRPHPSMSMAPRATTPSDPNAAIVDALPALLVGVDWHGVLDSATRAVLERQALGPFLQRQRWFASKSREIRQARFSDWTTIRK